MPESRLVVRLPGIFACCRSLLFLRIFPLLSGNRLEKLLHSLRACLPHAVRHVSVAIQREGGGGVTQIFLHGFDVVAVRKRGNGIGVTQIVHSGLRKPD